MSQFRADCSRCCGLCCVVPVQLAVQGFGTDKRAETPCKHLDPEQRCAIHASRRSMDYPACVNFDCYGAGQWITQRLFAGASWRDSPERAARMFAAYRHWAPRFEAAAMIEVALPRLRKQRRGEFIVLMNALVCDSIAGPPAGTTDAVKLRRTIRAALRSALSGANGPQ